MNNLTLGNYALAFLGGAYIGAYQAAGKPINPPEMTTFGIAAPIAFGFILPAFDAFETHQKNKELAKTAKEEYEQARIYSDEKNTFVDMNKLEVKKREAAIKAYDDLEHKVKEFSIPEKTCVGNGIATTACSAIGYACGNIGYHMIKII